MVVNVFWESVESHFLAGMSSGGAGGGRRNASNSLGNGAVSLLVAG